VSGTADQDRIVESGLSSPLAMALSNPRRPDKPLEVGGRPLLRSPGYGEEEISRRNCRFLAGDGTEAGRPAPRGGAGEQGHLALALFADEPGSRPAEGLSYRCDIAVHEPSRSAPSPSRKGALEKKAA
jgi:hypothetical protein